MQQLGSTKMAEGWSVDHRWKIPDHVAGCRTRCYTTNCGTASCQVEGIFTGSGPCILLTLGIPSKGLFLGKIFVDRHVR